ncbi:hypothetical protein Y032_0213g2266 [Ancylostoma ceylanicum]|uniref:Uncharacterized protein n=1 Tax=Ancylostoma ceylanicum TaxID=53326 RepID=A0A016SKG0_9BILA|nr:hypothetical protein Y032_0213g2266 [Ancylostoma ceylanicum]
MGYCYGRDAQSLRIGEDVPERVHVSERSTVEGNVYTNTSRAKERFQCRCTRQCHRCITAIVANVRCNFWKPSNR